MNERAAGVSFSMTDDVGADGDRPGVRGVDGREPEEVVVVARSETADTWRR